MKRSLSLAAYLAYARGTPRANTPTLIPRPKGEFIWAHAADAGRADALLHLAERLTQQRPGLRVLLTSQFDLQQDHLEDTVIWQKLPEDSVAAADAFLNHWSPDLCLWTGGI